MLKVQEYLKQHSLEDLKREYGINSRVYEEDNLVLLDYDMNDTGTQGSKSHPIVIECRSLILSADNHSVVSRKFDRFFNAGECPDYYTDFSFQFCTAYEKADGSLIGVYYNPHTSLWEISTRGMAKAEGLHYMGKTFREMVLDAFGFDCEDSFQSFCRGKLYNFYTYVFEYTSPLNKIVTPYEDDCMVLLSAQDEEGRSFLMECCELLPYALLEGLRVRLPKGVTVSSLEEAIQYVESLTGLQEGFVLYDRSSGKRMKVKNSTYLVAHKLRGNDPVPTRKNILSLLLEGDSDEFLSYFPDFKKYIEPVEKEIEKFVAQMSEMWENVSHITDQKSFALLVKDLHGSGVLFDAKKKNKHPVECFHEMDVSKKVRLFEAQ